ncbi:MAG: hypothetical protein OZSIB_3493 [Candidatus Ozemobacter sibiricus]|uniref:Uncharacterized protein n=1 Tax=Candidatus Ozemobacter sibiricus TaxID=2268124 RepID=A0A367ZSJ1_9BACT|nr:MAG: hypothetical protein OZSIB_3493 [Candidatus Ozemobacter sibiricus]
MATSDGWSEADPGRHAVQYIPIIGTDWKSVNDAFCLLTIARTALLQASQVA